MRFRLSPLAERDLVELWAFCQGAHLPRTRMSPMPAVWTSRTRTASRGVWAAAALIAAGSCGVTDAAATFRGDYARRRVE